MNETVLVVLLLVGVFAFVGVFLGVYLALRPRWHRLGGAYAAVEYAGDVDSVTLYAAVEWAVLALARHAKLGYVDEAHAIASIRSKLNGGWAPGDGTTPLPSPCLRIYVHPSESWNDSFGRKVGGISIGVYVEVSRSLSSLCHELCHVLEDAMPDATHESWDAKGFWAADSEYRSRWERQ